MEATGSVLQGPYSEGQASSFLLINHPFIREELEVREEEMLPGGCAPPFPNSAFPFATCQDQVWVPESPQTVKGSSRVSLSCQSCLRPGRGAGDVPIREVRKYT